MNKLFVLIFMIFSVSASYAQSGKIIIDANKEKMYAPYLYHRHGGPEGLEEFKKDHRYDYLKEMWYFTESFYISRDLKEEGVTMDASIIDISRFESSRKEEEDVVLMLPGYKDGLVLLAGKKLIFKY